jgi:hypothetical protein
MGLQVNQTTLRSLDVPSNASETRQVPRGTQEQSVPLGFRPPSENGAAASPFQREERQPDRVGFGRGSVTIPTAAVRTIDRNLEAAEQIVPTLEETREQIRERLAEVQEQLEGTRTEPAPIQSFDVSVGRAEAVGQARSFVNAVNEAASTAIARLQGQTPPSTGPRIDIRVGDETTPLLRQTESPAFEFFA